MPNTARILLVDENKPDVELMLNAFRELGSQSKVNVIETGPATMEYLVERVNQPDRLAHPLPDLILGDLKTLKTAGSDVLHQIKAEPVLRRIPLIVLTSASSNDRNSGVQDGAANSYLVKPSTPSDFLELVKHVEDYWLKFNIGPPK